MLKSKIKIEFKSIKYNINNKYCENLNKYAMKKYHRHKTGTSLFVIQLGLNKKKERTRN